MEQHPMANGDPPVGNQLTAAEWQALADITLGRFQGPELLFSQTTTLGGTAGGVAETIRPANPINLARPLESLEIVLRGRLVIGTAAYTVGAPESPQTLIERIVVRGNHRVWGSQVPIDISGATAYVWPRIFQPVGNNLLLGTTRSADPGMPFVGTTGLTTGAVATYDFQCHYRIPVWPIQWSRRQAIPFLWRQEDWGNTLQIEITVGDRTSLGTPAGGTTTTWTAYGSATGSPTVEVFANYSLLGSFARTGIPGLVVRTEQTVTPALTAVTSNVQLGAELRKQITTNVVVKSGIRLAGTTGGVTIFGSLSDVQLDRTRIVVDQKPIRDTGRNYASKNYYGSMYSTVIPQGYFLLSFVEAGNNQLALRSEKIPQGAAFTLTTDVLTADANNRQTVIQEQVYGGPFR
jgi:hypothetical protein